MTRIDAVSDSTRIAIGRALAVAAIVLGGGSIALLLVLGGREFLVGISALTFGVMGVGYGVLTAVMIRSQPRNGAVWAIAWAGVFASLYIAGAAAAWVLAGDKAGVSYEAFRLLSPSQLPRPSAIAIHFRFWTVYPAIWLSLTLGFLLFPTGHPPSPRWKWVGVWSGLAITMSAVAAAISGNPWSTQLIRSAEAEVDGLLGLMIGAGFVLALASSIVSVGSLIVRYRRSDGVARSQIRWIAFGGATIVAFLLLSPTLETTGPGTLASEAVGVAMMAVLMTCYGIAITRYHLYDIDIVISRTVTYGVLAAFITGVYALVVVGIGSLLGGGDEPNLALSITAVAIVAVAFEPLRKRVQHWANVLVYGRRATPYEVLADATTRLADTSDPDQVLSEITQLVVDGTGASEVVLWLAVGEAMHPRAASPAAVLEELSTVGPGTDSLSRIPGGSVIAVRHRGDVLGALSITKPRGDSVTGADEKVLADVAAGAGALLRNLGLNAELAERAEELRLSRRRLVATHDAERHRLERDLHDGAQQQVVALKVKLGIARTLAEREGAEPVAALVTALSDTVQQAVDGMRAVAHGIYPPLLEAEGLEAALNAAKRTIPIPVEIVGSRIRRYGRQVEEGVYFAVLGIVTQAVDAGATRAIISVTGGEDSVAFRVDVDAAPRDLTAVTDRVDALDGTLTVSGDIGEPRITGTVPSTPAMEYA